MGQFTSSKPCAWAVDCSPGLYQSLRGSVGLGSRSRDSTAPLPGRLVGSLLLGEEGQGVDQGAPLGLSHPRDCDKREEVGPRALAVCEVSRYDHRYRCRQGLPVSSKSREVPYGSGEILYHAISPQLSFGRWSWVTWLRWSGWFLTVDFGCAHCSGI